MAGAQSTIISKGMRYRKLDINPIEDISAMEYCTTCQDEIDTQTEQGKWGKVWVYRKRCLRCGSVIQWGVAKVCLQSKDPLMMKSVASWIRATGQDRR